MDLLHYLYALQRRWHIIIGAVVIALAVGFLVNAAASSPSQNETDQALASSYSATALLLNTGSSGSAVPGLPNIDNYTLARLAKAGEIPQRVADRLGGNRSPLELASKVDVIPDQESAVLEIVVLSADPNEARQLSNGFATEIVNWLGDEQTGVAERAAAVVQESVDDVDAELVDLRAQIELDPPNVEVLEAEHASLSEYAQSLRVQLRELEIAATAPPAVQIITKGIPQPTPGANYAAELSGPQGRGLRLGLAGILGLIAGVGIALLLDRIDTRIRTKYEAEEHFRAPVLAEIPYLARPDRGRVPIAAAKPKSRSADAFRLLATSLFRHDSKSSWESRPKTILITSAEPGEGKSTVVANLAAALAEMGQSVLTMSCDFRRPRIHELLGVPNATGLSDAIRSRNGQPILHKGNVLQSAFLDLVRVVPSGSVPDKPGELLSSEGMRRALTEARQLADVVLLDTSPVLSAGDAVLLLEDVDAVLVVARSGRTHTNEAEQTAGLLTRLRAPVRGVVLTGSSSSRHYGSDDGDTRDGLLKGFSRLARHSGSP